MRLIKKKSEKAQITNISNEKGDITTDCIQQKIKKIRKLYASQLEKADKMDQFPENYNLAELIQDEKEILTSPLSNEAIDKTLPTKKQTQEQKITGDKISQLISG